MKAQNTEIKSKSGRGFEFARRVALSAPGKILLAAALILSLGSIPLLTRANGQNGHNGNEKKTLTGNWISTATRLDPLPGQALTFLSIQTFFEDGNFLEENNESAPRSAGRGHWERTGHQQFTNSFVFFRFDAAGNYAGTVRPTTTITLSDDGSEFHGDTEAKVYNVSGNLLRTLHISGIGQRL